MSCFTSFFNRMSITESKYKLGGKNKNKSPEIYLCFHFKSLAFQTTQIISLPSVHSKSSDIVWWTNRSLLLIQIQENQCPRFKFEWETNWTMILVKSKDTWTNNVSVDVLLKFEMNEVTKAYQSAIINILIWLNSLNLDSKTHTTSNHSLCVHLSCHELMKRKRNKKWKQNNSWLRRWRLLEWHWKDEKIHCKLY